MTDETADGWKKRLREKFEQTVNNAITEEEFNELMQEREALFDPPKEWYSYDEMVLYWQINDRLMSSAIFVETLAEFRCLLQWYGLKDEQLTGIMARENARANLAEQFNAFCEGYILFISKGFREGREAYLIVPEADVYIPDFWEEEKRDAVFKMIEDVPRLYGL